MRILCCFIFLIFAVQQCSAQTYIENVTPQIVIEKAIEAMGGKEYLKSISTLYTKSLIKINGKDCFYVVKEMKPNMGSFEVMRNDTVIYKNSFDGRKAHAYSNNKRVNTSKNTYANIKYKRNIFNELDYLDPSIWKIELVGHEDVENEDCYQIKATLANGSVRLVCYSTKTFYLIKEENLTNIEGRYEKTIKSEFKKQDKLIYPSVMKLINQDNTQILTIVNVKINEDVNETDFK
jgi:hypothetical protein